MTLVPTQIPDWAKKQLAGQTKLSQPEHTASGGLELSQAPDWAVKQSLTKQFFVGDETARLAMFPGEHVDSPADLPNVFERGFRGVAYGISQMIPSSITLAAGVVDFLGADDLAGDMAQASLGIEDWLGQHVAVENPTFYDHLMQGVGSMASFLVPGLGAAGFASKGAQALGLAGKAAKTFQAITQGGAMAFLEAGVEQSQRMNELIAQGRSPEEALAESESIFWQNMLLLTASNAPFFSPGRRIAKLALGAVTEGGQERAQSVIQDVASARGQWSDFFDPGKYGTETAIGAILGGGAGALLGGGRELERPAEDGKTEEAPLQKPPADMEVPPEAPAGQPGPAVFPLPADVYRDAPQEEVERMVAVGQLEAGLNEAYGADFRLADRLTPEQFNEVAEIARQAVLEPDNKKAWALEDEAWRLAEQYLLRDPSIVPTGKRGEAQLAEDVFNTAANEGTGLSPEDQEAAQSEVGQMLQDQRATQGAQEAERAALSNFPGLDALGMGSRTTEAPAAPEQAPAAQPEQEQLPINLGQRARERKRAAKEQAKLARKRELEAEKKRRFDEEKARKREIKSKIGMPVVPEEEPAPAQPAELAELPRFVADLYKDGAAPVRATAEEAIQDVVDSGGKFYEDGYNLYEKNGSYFAMEPWEGPGQVALQKDGWEIVEQESVPIEPAPKGLTPDEKSPGFAFNEEMLKMRAAQKKARENKAEYEGEYESVSEQIADEQDASGEEFDPEFKALSALEAYENKYGAQSRNAEELRADYEAAAEVHRNKKKAAPDPAVQPKQKKSATKDILPVAAITTDEETFQMRDALNEEFVQDKVDNFSEFDVEPITVWRNPETNEWVVLDGHHTLEILKRVGKKEAEVKIFKGTRQEAIAKSEKINAQKQGVRALDAVKTLRKHVEAGDSKASLKILAKELGEDNANTYLAMAYLNPKGSLMQAVRDMMSGGGDTADNVRKIARWIGLVRQADSKLTDAHEQEMFDFLRGRIGNKGYQTQQEFVKRVQGITDNLHFKYDGALNLANATSKSPTRAAYDVALALAEKNLKEAQKARDEKQASLVAKDTPAAEIERLMKRYHDDVLIAEREYMAVNGEEGRVASTDQGTMFNIAEEGPNYIDITDENGETHRVLSSVTIKDFTKEQIKRGISSIGTIVGWPEATTKEQKAAVKAAEALGVRLQFFDMPPSGGSLLQGFYPHAMPGRPQANTIYVNVQSRDSIMAIVGHEAGHWMEVHHPEQWVSIGTAAANMARAGGPKQYKATLSRRVYKNPVSWAREMVSDLVADAWTKQSFWDELARLDPGAFKTLRELLKNLLAKIRSAFVAGRSGDMGIYFDNMASLENTIAKATSEIAKKNKAAKKKPAPAPEKGPELDLSTTSIHANVKELDAPESSKRNIEERRKMESGLKKAKIRSWRDMPRAIYQKIIDRDTWLYRAVKTGMDLAGQKYDDLSLNKNPYQIVRKFAGWVNVADGHLKHAVYKYGTQVSDSVKPLARGLEVILKDFGLAHWVDNGLFGEFMISARIVSGWEYHYKKALKQLEKDSEGFLPENYEEIAREMADEAYFEDDAAKAEFEEHKAAYEELQQLHPTWYAAAKEITNWSNAIMSRLLDSKAITEEMYNTLIDKYDIYAPLFVLNRETPSKGAPLHRMDKFRAGMVRSDPMDSFVKSAYTVEYFVQKNRAKMAMAEFIHMLAPETDSVANIGRRVRGIERPLQDYVSILAKEMGIGDLSSASEEVKATLERLANLFMEEQTSEQLEKYFTPEYENGRLISFTRNGVTEYWEVTSDVADVYDNLGRRSTHQLMKFFTAQTRLLRAGAILTPDFMVRNQMRDPVAAMIISKKLVTNPKDAFLVPVRIARGLMHSIGAWRGNEDALVRDFFNAMAGQSTLVSLDQESLRKKVSDLLEADKAFKASKAKESPIKYILHSHPIRALQTISNITELSTRLAVFEKTRADLLNEGKSIEEATAIAATEAREASTDFNRAGEYALVLNKMIPFFNASLQGQDKLMRTLFRDQGKGAAWVKGAALLTAPSVLLWILNHDEDWYKDAPDWMKNHFWMFSVDGGKTVVKIPKPFDVGLLFASLPERVLDWAYNEDKDAVSGWAESVRKDVFATDPLSLLGPMAQSLSEARANYDHYRDTPIIKGFLQEVEPRAQYTANTSEFAKWLGDTWPGRGLSPLLIDHFIQGSFAGIGTYASDIASNVIMLADPSRRDVKPSSRLLWNTVPDWMPVIKSLVDAQPRAYTQDMNDFYESYDRSREAMNTLRAYKAGGATVDQFMDLYRRSAPDIAMYEVHQRAADQIGKISKRIKAYESAPPSVLSRKEKREKIDELFRVRGEMIRRLMKKLNEVDRKAIQDKANEAIPRLERQWAKSAGR